jgi:hypothetical protein
MEVMVIWAAMDGYGCMTQEEREQVALEDPQEYRLQERLANWEGMDA